MREHTPGPWRMEDDPFSSPYLVGANGEIIIDVETGWYESMWVSFNNPADRFLTAAAPELLALLKRYRAETPLGHQPHMIAAEADAAIAKATGVSE